MGRREPDVTRRRLLEAGQAEVYVHGFQATSVDAILATTGLTKGAFFHHFRAKADFGYALVDEILTEMITAQWVTPLRDAADVPLTIAAEFEKGAAVLAEQQPILGCPLNNLAQEMNPLDEGFRQRTCAVFTLWQDSFRSALTRTQRRGDITADADPADIAQLLVAQIEGVLSLARNSQDPRTLTTGARGLRRYLDSLRVT
jgi:TetR/AcrR family transcriptional repressor of nem operon